MLTFFRIPALVLFSACTGLIAQDTAPPVGAAAAGTTAPVRSVAVVVDVSGSVSASFAVEARDIIQSIVAGRGFQAGNGWGCNFEAPEPVDPAGEDTWPEDETLRTLFQPYWAGGKQQKPLTAAGKVFHLALCGTLQTTMNPPRTWDLAGSQEFEALMQQEFPARPDQFRDMRTCYYIATARTADRLLQRSEEGCYLFVVSDEWDDPDSKHSPVNEWMPHLEKWGIYDVRYQAAMVARFHELKDSDRFHLIARFHKGDRPKRTGGSKNYLRVAWYAVGEKPQSVVPKPVVQVKVGEPPPPPPPEPPKPPVFGRSLTLLGGLTQAGDAADSAKPDASRMKVFTHSEPFLAWQVEGISANSVDSQFEVTVHRLDSSNALQSVQKLRSAQLNRTTEGRLRGLPAGTVTQPLTDGVYRITIEEKAPAGTTPAPGALLDPVAAWIEVKTPFNWLPWLLSVSALGAAGVIGYSVWSLRK